MVENKDLASDNASTGESWFVPRPARLLLDLPVTYRWEVTRRHPYYLRFWDLARLHLQQPSEDPVGHGLGQSAVLILQAIGVSTDPPHPGTSAQDLGAFSLGKAWECGAVALITFRGLAGMLLTGLPASTRAKVGELLIRSAASCEDAQQQEFELFFAFAQLRDPALDASPNRPVVGVNLQSPQRVILQAMEQLVQKWKQQENIPERRRRDDKLEPYLTVWDRREGWVGDHYEAAREQTLGQVAKELSLPLSTAANRYRSAFRLIVGREYCPELWARVLGFLKLYEWLDPENLPQRTLNRPWRNRKPREVSESALRSREQQAAGAPGVLNTAGVSQDEVSYVELVLDIRELLDRGWSDEEIVTELELSSPSAPEIIAYLRERQRDSL